ncbi:unnamed protein product [Polarella glacialis]|uniref:Alpha-type protein kinase domain-containing protein n=1 Tax=Polarella glacialis TaxID=89957 RepID=A0A813GG53_POLGL|nr:unnamed protein product [Polarella glacialis]
MVCKKTGSTSRVVPETNIVKVQLRKRPFEVGGLRLAYHLFVASQGLHGQRTLDGKHVSEVHLVAKQSKFEEKYADRLKVVGHFFEQHSYAAARAEAFNQVLRVIDPVTYKRPVARFVTAEVYRLRDVDTPGGFQYLLAEQFIQGSFTKFNDNDGYVNPAPSSGNDVAQAFSHWTIQESKRTSAVVDIQGAEGAWTDPQVHSVERVFGDADLGERGIFLCLFVENAHLQSPLSRAGSDIR